MKCALHKKTLLKAIIRCKSENVVVQGKNNYNVTSIGMSIFHKILQGPFKLENKISYTCSTQRVDTQRADEMIIITD
jgi:hypothetical protein